MTREQFGCLCIDEMFEVLVNEKSINDLWTYEDLKNYAIEQVENDNLNVALHILDYIYHNQSEYYQWDCTMGTMEELRALSCEEDFTDLVDNVYEIEFDEVIFDDEYNIFCYSDENGDNLVYCEHTSEYENAVAIADDLSEKFERVEILDKFGEKVY